MYKNEKFNLTAAYRLPYLVYTTVGAGSVLNSTKSVLGVQHSMHKFKNTSSLDNGGLQIYQSCSLV